MRAQRDLLVQALQGQCTPQHRLLIAEQRAPIETCDEEIAHLKRREMIPGIKQRLADIVPAMQRVSIARHLASWAGTCPGNRESAGTRLSGNTRTGNLWRRTALVEAAHAAMHWKHFSLATQSHRLVLRIGSTMATMAVGHTLLVMVYHV